MKKVTSLGKKIIGIIEKFIRSFNFAFFLVSLSIWAFLTIDKLLTQPFEISLLWDALNNMYAQLSFKVSCIILIVINGLQTVRSWIFMYYDLRENAGHISTIGKLVGRKKNV